MIKRKVSYSSKHCRFLANSSAPRSNAAVMEIARLYHEKRQQKELIDDIKKLVTDFDLHSMEGTAGDYLVGLQTTMDAIRKLVQS